MQVFLIKQKEETKFRNLLSKCISKIPKKKSVEITTHFARLEFKFGSVERGRTLFESLVSNFPKRTDIWSIWLDMEIKVEETDKIRALLQRITSLNISTKKMKGFFKRYLEFEKNIWR